MRNKPEGAAPEGLGGGADQSLLGFRAHTGVRGVTQSTGMSFSPQVELYNLGILS